MPVRLVETSPKVKNTLEFLYEHLPVEFSVCAYGKIRGSTVLIERVDLPVIFMATEDQVLSDPGSCSKKDILGVIHSHRPGYFCRFSPVDVREYFSDEYFKNYKLDFLYCSGSLLWQSKTNPP